MIKDFRKTEFFFLIKNGQFSYFLTFLNYYTL